MSEDINIKEKLKGYHWVSVHGVKPRQLLIEVIICMNPTLSRVRNLMWYLNHDS